MGEIDIIENIIGIEMDIPDQLICSIAKGLSVRAEGLSQREGQREGRGRMEEGRGVTCQHLGGWCPWCWIELWCWTTRSCRHKALLSSIEGGFQSKKTLDCRRQS